MVFYFIKQEVKIKLELDVLILYFQGLVKKTVQTEHAALTSEAGLFVPTINTSLVHVCNFFFHLYKDRDSNLYKQDSLSKKCDISISVV